MDGSVRQQSWAPACRAAGLRRGQLDNAASIRPEAPQNSTISSRRPTPLQSDRPVIILTNPGEVITHPGEPIHNIRDRRTTRAARLNKDTDWNTHALARFDRYTTQPKCLRQGPLFVSPQDAGM